MGLGHPLSLATEVVFVYSISACFVSVQFGVSSPLTYCAALSGWEFAHAGVSLMQTAYSLLVAHHTPGLYERTLHVHHQTSRRTH